MFFEEIVPTSWEHVRTSEVSLAQRALVPKPKTNQALSYSGASASLSRIGNPVLKFDLGKLVPSSVVDQLTDALDSEKGCLIMNSW